MFCLGRGEWRRLVEAARSAYPREACGLLFAPPRRRTELRLIPTAGRWNTPLSFRITARDIELAREQRKLRRERLVGCFHSHVVAPARPSRFDRQAARTFGGLWLIYSIPHRRAALFQWGGSSFIRRALRLL